MIKAKFNPHTSYVILDKSHNNSVMAIISNPNTGCSCEEDITYKVERAIHKYFCCDKSPIGIASYDLSNMPSEIDIPVDTYEDGELFIQHITIVHTIAY